ncbi:MAG TPA: hypothetical protein VF476_02620 [Chitinophagaceae bacterium]
MEIHHHSHTPHKKWLHYFYEFLMLFLAVLCGFFAENQREHMIEHKREKDYIKLLVEDLQTDTAIIHRELPGMKEFVKGLDTLIGETYAFLQGKGDTRMMYYNYHRYCRNHYTVLLSQRAINQLKNSGNMRLIRDKEALVLILDAEVGFQQLDAETKRVIERQESTSQFGTRIFDFGEYQKANINPDGSTNERQDGFLKLNYQPALNTTDNEYIKEFIARVGYYRNTLDAYIRFDLQDATSFFEKAITELKKNYRL